MSIFEERNFTETEKNAIKMVITDTIESYSSINDLNEHIKENVKSLCDTLNENVDSNDQKIKPSVITKLAKTKMKEDLEAQKEKVSEVETGLEILYGSNI